MMIDRRELLMSSVGFDRPETLDSFVRVAGPFAVEATIPSSIELDGDGKDDTGEAPEAYASYIDRMLEVLRRSPVLQVGGGKLVTLKNTRAPAKSLSLSAEAMVENGNGKPKNNP
jgi:adenine-specific DNA-methyltransferase